MKRGAIWANIGLFVVTYSGFLAYRYQFDRPPVSNDSAVQAPSTPTDSAPRNRSVLTEPIQKSVAVFAPQQTERKISSPARATESPSEPVFYLHVPPTRSDEIAAMGSLMSDPDPDVARVARDAYKHMAAGE